LRTIAAIAAILLLAAWAGAATTYVLFRDDALRLLADRQVALARAHDREVGSLLTEIERLRSIKLLDQQRVERTLADLIRRQVQLEQRQAAFQTLAPAMDPAADTTAAIPAPRPTAPKPSPLRETPERRTEVGRPPTKPVDAQLAKLAEQLARAEATQTHALEWIESGYDSRVTRMRSVLAELGVVAAQPTAPARSSLPAGGPFLPLFRAGDPFAQRIARVRVAARDLMTLSQAIDTVPVRQPLLGAVEITSGYGMRIDPFLRQLALHTGIDFRAGPGDPVRAVAAGKVTQAGYQGGYGLMVEIDHGNGLATRYAHLSAVEVAEGATVPAGTVVGRAGTTGRSTAPHLHYEVRRDGEPVDPLRFLKAGARLQGF
jgi:murein DD-endopeptidase MepM/ murein hydrolase activator NlpD